MTPARTEALLRWYFRHGVVKFQRSTHAAIEARLVRDSCGSTECRVCGGVGILETPDAVAASKRRGKGTEKRTRWKLVERRGVTTDEQVTEWAPVGIGSECQCCRGTGTVPQMHPTRKCRACKRLDGEELSEWRLRRRACRECLGTGVATVTARPTCTPQEPSGVEVEHDVLRNFAKVSRRLCRRQRIHQLVLELYYGPQGDSWAAEPGGRIVALEGQTQAGKRLLERTRVKGDESSAEERLSIQIQHQRADPKPWRRELLEQAVTQAEELRQEAIRAWDGALWQEELTDLCNTVDRTGEQYGEWLDRNQDVWQEDADG
jgi:hypothetical protein